MNHDEILRQLHASREQYLTELVEFRKWYLKDSLRSDDGFETLDRLPEGVEWVWEEEMVKMKGTAKGLQELSQIIKAFAHDEETIGIFHGQFLLLKHHEPMPYEGLTVIAMPDEAWAVWGGKIADVAWGHDVEETSFNSLGFFEETLPVDLGVCLMDRNEADPG